MKLFAVAHVNAYDNELTIEFHRGVDWIEALKKHSKLTEFEVDADASLDSAKQEAFNKDTSIDVKEVPENA